MSADSNRPNASRQTPPPARRFTARCRRLAGFARQAVIVLAGSGVVLSGGLSAADPSIHDGVPPSSLSVDGGFTRETLQEFDAPEPAPFAPAPLASVQESDEPARSTAASRHRRQARRHQEAPKNQGPVVVVKAPPRRSPVVSFVYWWNGWVIRTFHTKIGTVLLGTVGAKT